MISTPPSVPNFSSPLAMFSQARPKAAPNSPFSQVDSIINQPQPTILGQGQGLRNPSNTGQKTLLGQ